MASQRIFRAVLLEHGYASTQVERSIIESSGAEFIDGELHSPEKAMELCHGADAIMLRRIQVPRVLLQSFKRCQFLLRYGVGVDNIDVPAATDLGILIGHVPVYCSDEVSSHAIALLLAAVRKVVETHQKMTGGGWDVHRESPIYRMAGKTLGLLGFGNIGQAVARKMRNWGLRIIACDPHIESGLSSEFGVELLPFEQVCAESDYLSLHLPLLPETRHLINPATLAMVKRGAILINTARGPIVDEVALLAALDDGILSQAGIDVFEQEPLPPGAPIRGHPRVILTDHVGWYSEDSQSDLQRCAAEEVARVARGGLPIAIANPEVLEKLGREAEWTPNSTARWQRLRSQKPGVASAAVQQSFLKQE